METRDVVVVGAGLVGLSTAYHLAELGVTNVVVLEREEMWGQGSSGRSAGGVRLEFSNPSGVRFSQYALELIEHAQERLGVHIPFHACGYLFLTRQKERFDTMQTLGAMQRGLGVPVEILGADEIGHRFPYVEMSDLLGGTFCDRDGIGDPGGMLYGFARAAKAAGVDIRLGEAVTGILVEGGRVHGVRTARGDIATPHVVNAAGPFARHIGQLAGIDVPVTPYRRSIYVTDAFDGLPDDMPMTLDLDTTSYLRREGRSILMGMSDPNEPASENTQTDAASLETLIGTLLSWVPRLERAAVMRGWAGLYEVSPDDSAIIGPVQERPGFYCANGFSGHGFMHAPAAGRVIAELIAGHPPFVDITPFRLERFKDRQKTRESFVI